MNYLPAQIISKKKLGQTHDIKELEFLVREFTADRLPAYQMSAWLMATCFKGLTQEETANLTGLMKTSGRVLDFSNLKNFPVDKHSTGGIGDKTSLIIGPIVAAAGLSVPMMAGRGLGHTGGTVDKLESINGFNTKLDLERFQELVSEKGLSIIGQTEEICPADRKLYALRDVTSTVDSINLICASIMSKKLAEGIQGLVMDVKYGTGAFMKTVEEAEELARLLQYIGEANGLTMTSFITNMNQPLGRFIGNWLEVKECIDIMEGQTFVEDGYDFYESTRELSLTLSGAMIAIGGKADNVDDGYKKAKMLLDSGHALEKFKEMCFNQGAHEWPIKAHKSNHKMAVISDRSGYISGIDSEMVGWASVKIGVGRTKSSDPVDSAAGIEWLKPIGHKVNEGEPVAYLYSSSDQKLIEASEMILQSLSFTDDKNSIDDKPLVAKYISSL